jgi:CRP-like cAMP-binding protein
MKTLIAALAQRVAAFFVEIQGRLGQRRGSLELPMSRRDIADYLGLSIETVVAIHLATSKAARD